MEVREMRKKLKEKYDYSEKWVKKVDNMSDPQVMAIYYRMIGK